MIALKSKISKDPRCGGGEDVKGCYTSYVVLPCVVVVMLLLKSKKSKPCQCGGCVVVVAWWWFFFTNNNTNLRFHLVTCGCYKGKYQKLH